MLIYLCAVTLILLISSYYRMSLYDNAYGFTRLRVLVYIFLIFEALGLLATFTYIIKYNFNLFTTYAVIGLSFYLALNIVNIDGIIAKRNIDMYLSKQAEIDIDYLMTLSFDAIPQIVRLTDSDVQIMTRIRVINYLDNIKESYIFSANDWRNYNLSIQKSKKLLKEQAEVFHNTNK